MDRSDDEYRIELFVFPDGTAMEMIVFDREGAPSPTRAVERHDGQSCCVDHRDARRRPRGRKQKVKPTCARSAAARWSTPSTGEGTTRPPGT